MPNTKIRPPAKSSAAVLIGRPCDRYLPKLSNSPFRTRPRKACHSSGLNRRTGPPESLLLRTPISAPGKLATSTQLPLA
jgi:hypothetical protein